MSINYSITLTWNNEKSKLVIPVLPEEIKIKNGISNSKVSVAELGEIYEKGTPNCREYSWESFFPAYMSPLVSVSYLNSPRNYLDQLMNLMNNQTVVHLVVSGMGITEYCLITKLDYSEEGGDVGTLNYEITLIQYKQIKIRKLTKSSSQTNSSSRPSTNSTSKTYTVKSGDCLWSIAQSQLGDGSKWLKIYDLNVSVITSTAEKNGTTASKNYPVIFAGTVLKLP